MKKILVFGSTCVDHIITLDHLPVTGEDLHPTGQSMNLGGCACNVAHVLKYSGAHFTFLTPVGSGIYGDFVRQKLTEHGFPILISVPDQENGCCYCLVEATGERTFLSLHGAEYTFREEWLGRYSMDEYSMVYLCGLEVEEPTGEELVDYFERCRGPQIFFAPGPRWAKIPKNRLDRLFALSPILHINEQEALELSGETKMETAARHIADRTANSVIITLGERGACCLDRQGTFFSVPGYPATVVDTIGAGDSHIGAVLSCLQKGMDLKNALNVANRISAAVVGNKGAILPEAKVQEIFRSYSQE